MIFPRLKPPHEFKHELNDAAFVCDSVAAGQVFRGRVGGAFSPRHFNAIGMRRGFLWRLYSVDAFFAHGR